MIEIITSLTYVFLLLFSLMGLFVMFFVFMGVIIKVFITIVKWVFQQ